MATATMSMLGLYRANKGLFDFLKIPEGLDKSVLVDNILVETAELEVLYADAEFMRWAIGIWSEKELDKWSELEKTRHYDYNPINNYDRSEKWTDSGSNSATYSDSNTRAGNSLGKQAGYNSENLYTQTGTEENETNSTNGTSSGSDRTEHSGTISGNIGVTTTQQMIQEQRDIVNYSVYDVIINSFKQRFCLLIY